MARSKKKGAVARKRTSRRAAARGVADDAIALLKGDHRQVEGWFSQFEKPRSNERKQKLAVAVCKALRVHTTIEEQIFYPAFFEATDDRDTHHEAVVEHAAAKKLIAEDRVLGPGDDYFDAKVSVLSELIKHHVKEEERPKGMFAAARASELDLQGLGARLKARKEELMGGSA